MSAFRKFRRWITTGRAYNDETDAAIREVQAHARGEIELERGHEPDFVFVKNEKPHKTRYEIYQSSRFRSDLDRMLRKGADISELDAVIDILANGGVLPKRYRDHALRGYYKGDCECHIRPDWRLVYSRDDRTLILYEIRTGSHSDLFRRSSG